jgi:predicted ATPase/DNA-binding CsgD family transcriptional regulator
MSSLPLTVHAAELPAVLTPLIGRDRERALGRGLLRRSGVRLVTFTGPGGVGKTRLALQVAGEVDADGLFPDGVVFIPLASIADPALVMPTIARALGVQEGADRALRDRIARQLGGRRILILLDNLEHLVAAAAELAGLLEACPDLTLLVTSRIRLRLRGEYELAVPPLTLPGADEPVADLTRSEAVRLFAARARELRPDFALTPETAPTVAEIVRRLDGLPLAIELAAARLKILSPEALLARLSRRLQLLTDGARDLPTRLRTMRDAVAWSDDLLAPVAQALFRRLGVFAGGFTLEAAEAVTQGLGASPPSVLDGLAALVDHSLVVRSSAPSGSARYVMLETIREYALERLADAGEEEEIRRRHAAYALTFAERAEPELTGSAQAAWLARLVDEEDNLRSALAWSLEREPATALRLAAALWRFWFASGRFQEGSGWLERALATDGGALEARAKALDGLLRLCSRRADYASAAAAGEEALILFRTLGDKRGVASALNGLGLTAAERGDRADAVRLFEESLARYRRIGDRHGTAACLNNLARLTGGERALELLEEALAVVREIGSTHAIGHVLQSLGNARRSMGDRAGAAVHYRESLTIAAGQGDRYLVADNLGSLARVSERPRVAARLFGAEAALREAIAGPVRQNELADHERDVDATRARLGQEGFERAWAAGRALPLERAIAEALGPGEPGTATPGSAGSASGAGHVPLTPRETDVLRLLAQGHSDRQIAEALAVSPRTVTTHVTHILDKLRVDARTAAVAYAVRHGLV